MPDNTPWTTKVADIVSDRIVQYHKQENDREGKSVLDLHDLFNGAIAGAHITENCGTGDDQVAFSPGELLPIKVAIESPSREAVKDIITNMVSHNLGDADLIYQGIEFTLRICEHHWGTPSRAKDNRCLGCVLQNKANDVVGDVNDAIIHIAAVLIRKFINRNPLTGTAYGAGIVDALAIVDDMTNALDLEAGLKTITTHNDCKLCAIEGGIE